MPKKIQNTTKADLISVPLPNHGATYTVISHQFVIDYAYQALAAAGFTIVDEEYRCTKDGQIAQGIYKLNYNNDPELSMMFAWTNSYNKLVKFKCVVGAYMNHTGSVMISGEVGSWIRKHTGTADVEVKSTIDSYISNAHIYYDQLCLDKQAMENVNLNRRKQSQLLGVLFAEYEIITTEQASMIREQMKKPKQVFANTDSLWAFYNYVTNALQTSHPKTWMEDQRILHYFIGTICDFRAPVQVVSTPVEEETQIVDPLYADPGQTNILDQIAEIENSEEVVQDDAICADDLHQLNGNNLDVKDPNEAEEDVLTEDGIEVIEEELPWGNDEVITYTDPVGNTFEAPIVPPCAAHDSETEKDLEDEIHETEVENFFDTIEPDDSDITGDDIIIKKPFNLPVEDSSEANLNTLEVSENNSFEADFDLSFEPESPDDIPDFF